MKKLAFLAAVVVMATAVRASLVRMVPEHGVSKAFSLKTEDTNLTYTVRFYRPDVFRVEVGGADKYNDGVRAQILVDDYKEDTTAVKFADKDGKFTFKTTEIEVVFDKQSELMQVKNRFGEEIFAEAEKLAFTTNSCVQTLKSAKDVRYYGGGQQVGRFTHKGAKLLIDCDYNWSEGGAPNPAPFVMSSEGFGVLRHTFASGEYDFTEEKTCALKHDEPRFDAFYFIGDFPTVLNRYTEATGRPNMLPMWGLELGDADAYMTRENETKYPKQKDDGSFVEVTPDAVEVARKYRDADMPGAWLLVNDGYGCGYTMLGATAYDLSQYGFKTGLWTEGALDRIAWEVGTVGTRVQKLDVAWTSQGEDFKAQHALQCNKDAFLGITTNSNARAFIWTVLGWAGTQRYGICWAGDEYGGWDLIRYMIPTITGSAMSGQAYATTDVDGIFGGSNETYLRDLQWKCWTTAMYVMNGWSHLNKSPFSYPEPYKSHIRKALKDKIRLTPYIYAYMRESWETGAPIVRPMVYNYPEDAETWSDKTKYQFMLGKDFVVAPIYTAMKINHGWWRKGIYLPAGDWYDYNDGRRVKGGTWLMAYPIDLGKLPVFVRAGAIVPMYDEGLSTLYLDKSRITFDIWPGSRDGEFLTYEDDGETRRYQEYEQFARYRVATSGAVDARGELDDLEVSVKPCRGGWYQDCPEQRKLEFMIHLQSEKEPSAVVIGGREIVKVTSTNDVAKLFQNCAQGWYYDKDEKFGTLHVKLLPRPFGMSDETGVNFTIRMGEHGEKFARVKTPDYPQPTEEDDAAAEESAKMLALDMLKNRSSVVGENMVVTNAQRITVGPMDGTYRRITGHVATHEDNEASARFTFTIYANDEKIFERANMKGSDVPQLIAVDIPADKHWIKFDFKADDETEASKSAKGVWKKVEFVAE